MHWRSLLLVSCSSGCALLTNLQDLASDSGASDAINDVGDSSSSSDVNAGDADSGPPGTFSCQPPPSGTIFCDDFESSSSACDTTDGVQAYGAATAQIDPTHSVSPTHSAAFAAPALDGGFDSYACTIIRNVAASTLSVSFTVRVNSADQAQLVTVMSIGYGNLLFEIALETGNLAFRVTDLASDGSTSTSDYPLGAYQAGAWTGVRVDIAVSSPMHATVWLVQLAPGELEPSPVSVVGWSQAFFKNLTVAAPTDSKRFGFFGLVRLLRSTVATDFEIDNYLLRGF
jgi:hypothetical protein